MQLPAVGWLLVVLIFSSCFNSNNAKKFFEMGKEFYVEKFRTRINT